MFRYLRLCYITLDVAGTGSHFEHLFVILAVVVLLVSVLTEIQQVVIFTKYTVGDMLVQ